MLEMYERFEQATNELSTMVHQNAIEHGWYEGNTSIPEQLMLMVTELAEAMTEYRHDRPLQYVVRQIDAPECASGVRVVHVTDPAEWLSDEKPEGLASELADVVLRVFDISVYLGIDIGALITMKHEYNKTRAYKHGGLLL